MGMWLLTFKNPTTINIIQNNEVSFKELFEADFAFSSIDFRFFSMLKKVINEARTEFDTWYLETIELDTLLLNRLIFPINMPFK